MFCQKIALSFAAFSLLSVGEQQVSNNKVLDDKGKPVPFAKVTYRKDGKVVAEATADANGVLAVKVNIGDKFAITALTPEGAVLYNKIVDAATQMILKPDAPAKPDPAPAPPAFQEAKGKVEDSGSKPIEKARITIRSGEGQTTIVMTNESGLFQARVPNEKSYQIGVEANGYSPVTLQTEPIGLPILHVVLAKGAGSNVPCCNERTLPGWMISLCLGVYLAVAGLARYHNIVRVDREIIHAELQGLEQELERVDSEKIRKRITALIKNASKTLEGASKGAKSVSWTFLFAFRGEEVAAKTNILDARLALAESYSREEAIAKLRVVVEALRPEYTNMALKVEAALAKVNDADGLSTEFLRATLIEALRSSYEKVKVAEFEVMNWQNKAFTFIFVGCCLVAAMALILDNSVLIFLGLLGGFASRLMRGKTADTGDGSLSWTTLLLSPLYGGIAGWAGILILSCLTSLNVLGDAFKGIVWEQASCSNLSLGLAFLFGFSERLFSAVADMAEGAVTKRKNASGADSEETKPAPTVPAAGIPKGKAEVPAVPPAPAVIPAKPMDPVPSEEDDQP